MQWRRAARLTPPLTLLLMGQIIAVAVGAPLAFNELDHLGCVPRAAAPNAAGRRRWARMASCCMLHVACCMLQRYWVATVGGRAALLDPGDAHGDLAHCHLCANLHHAACSAQQATCA
jgi:hypothetical protein